ncbi:MAG: histidinol-phosphate transaminase [Thermostichus sp. DG_1_6_bins_120]
MQYLRSDLLDLKPYDAVLPVAADKLDANEFPWDWPTGFKQKLSLLWEKGIPSNRYPDANHHGLKQAIAAYAGADPSQISVGNGSDELIRSLLIATCLGGRGSILVPEPTFSMYAILAQSLGIPVVRIKRDPESFALNLEGCQQALAEHRIRVVCLVNPNSPTGNSLNTSEWAWVETLPPEILVVLDEAYFEFSRHTALPKLADHPNWVVLRTFSKAFRLAAHRVGYAMGHPQLIQVLESIRLPYNLTAFSQWAVQIALEHAEEFLADLPLLRQERETLYNALQQLPGVRVWPSQANFLYFQVEGWDPHRLQQEWQALGTCVRATGGGIRLTVGTPEENQRALERLRQLLQ